MSLPSLQLTRLNGQFKVWHLNRQDLSDEILEFLELQNDEVYLSDELILHQVGEEFTLIYSKSKGFSPQLIERKITVAEAHLLFSIYLIPEDVVLDYHVNVNTREGQDLKFDTDQLSRFLPEIWIRNFIPMLPPKFRGQVLIASLSSSSEKEGVKMRVTIQYEDPWIAYRKFHSLDRKDKQVEHKLKRAINASGIQPDFYLPPLILHRTKMVMNDSVVPIIIKLTRTNGRWISRSPLKEDERSMLYTHPVEKGISPY